VFELTLKKMRNPGRLRVTCLRSDLEKLHRFVSAAPRDRAIQNSNEHCLLLFCIDPCQQHHQGV
jgi:hypothetical protein